MQGAVGGCRYQPKLNQTQCRKARGQGLGLGPGLRAGGASKTGGEAAHVKRLKDAGRTARIAPSCRLLSSPGLRQ